MFRSALTVSVLSAMLLVVASLGAPVQADAAVEAPTNPTHVSGFSAYRDGSLKQLAADRDSTVTPSLSGFERPQKLKVYHVEYGGDIEEFVTDYPGGFQQ